MSDASEKAYDLEQRLNAHVPDGGHVDPDEGWINMGSASNSWSRGTGGWARYKFIRGDSVCLVSMRMQTVGTSTDGTVIFNSANGIQSPHRPAAQLDVLAFTDRIREQGAAGADLYTTPSVRIDTDGSLSCVGVAGSASTFRVNGLFPTDVSS